jgi:outer membrane protein OmpA-like peptidoglycan-associated protein
MNLKGRQNTDKPTQKIVTCVTALPVVSLSKLNFPMFFSLQMRPVAQVLGLFLLLMCVHPNALWAQSKKAQKWYNDAMLEAGMGKLESASSLLEQAIKRDPDFAKAHILLGDIRHYQEREKEAIYHYKEAMKYGGGDYLYYKLAIVYHEGGFYQQCLDAIQKYISSPQARKASMEKLERYQKGAEFALKAIQNPVPFDPQNMGPNINTSDLEYLPSLSADGRTLIFTSRSLVGEKQDEDFFISRFENGAWTPAQRLKGYLNSDLNEGAQCITADGSKLYFTACQREDGFGSCDIYESVYQGNGVWGPARNLGGNINSGAWESQPSISPDGRDIYFVRGKAVPGSSTKNLMVAHLREDGSWSQARPLPENINTPYEEEAPFMHFDNKTLYFTSDGHPGFGRKDFFYTKKQPEGTWSTPVNLGYPINSHRNEFSLVIGPNGRTTIFASDRLDGGFGNLDLWWFEMPEKLRPIPVAWMKGRVTDAITGKPVAAKLQFTDIGTNLLHLEMPADRNGLYFSVLPANRDYALTVMGEGYLFHSENFSLATQVPGREFILDVQLQPITSGSKVALRNVFFDTDSDVLKAASKAELQKVVQLMRDNPNIKVRFGGHTDNTGNAAYNKQLSRRRAEAVRKFMIESGIAANRMESVGYGMERPIATNDTEEGRALNRRTELEIQ